MAHLFYEISWKDKISVCTEVKITPRYSVSKMQEIKLDLEEDT